MSGQPLLPPRHSADSDVATVQGGIMRLTLRFLGLDLIDLSVDTDAACEHSDVPADDPGDCTTYPVGFTMPDPAPYELDCPDRDL